jgi:hypothetical protein
MFMAGSVGARGAIRKDQLRRFGGGRFGPVTVFGFALARLIAGRGAAAALTLNAVNT